MHYKPPDTRIYRRVLRQAYRIKQAKDKKRAIHTLCLNLRLLLGADDR